MSTTNGTHAPPLKTAIVTGACSGIGLAVTQHLLSLASTASHPFRWRVVLADIRPDSFAAISSTLDTSRALFVACDVSSWDDNAALFKAAWEWGGGERIDFLAANAGTDDKELIAAHSDLNAEPLEPDLTCLDVNLNSVFYQLKLFIHYARKTRLQQQSSSSLSASSPPSQVTVAFNPKMTITASCVGQYPFSVAPHYAASKHALVGLTRSVGDSLLKKENIAVNAVLPAFVPTALAPKGLVDAWPKEHVTPVSTVVAAFAELMDEAGRTGGKMGDRGAGVEVQSDGYDGVVKTGQCVECVQDKLFYRNHVAFANESQAWMIGETREGGLWTGCSGYGGKKEREGMA